MSHASNPVKSLWSHTAVEPPVTDTLEGATSTDVTIIGAGITGLRTALELASQGVSVTVLDSQQPGWGASGRSGGQVNPMAPTDPQSIIKKLGPTAGARIINSYIHSADEVFGLIERHGLKCDSVRKGWLRGAHCTAAIRNLEKDVARWTEQGMNIRLIDGDELQTLSGTSAYRAATLVPAGGCLHPLSYTRELVRVAREHGARVCFPHQVQSVNRQNSQWQVSTDKGTVTSDWVVFCTNAYTDSTLKGLRKTIIPLISVQAATRPLSPEEYAEYLPGGHTLSDTRRVIYYGRKDNRNRLLLGSHGSDEHCAVPDRKRLLDAFKTVFPKLKEQDIEYFWGGRLAFTPDHLPHLHEPDQGILAALGYNGRGIAMATVMGRVLAERVAGKRSEDLDYPTTPYSKVPFHWARDVGVRTAAQYLGFRDWLDIQRG